jgi:uncharacterized protein
VTNTGWWAMDPFCSAELNQSQQRQLLRCARRAISDRWNQGDSAQLTPSASDPDLSQARGVFVTLNKRGVLRGCIGVIETAEPLIESVADCARGAAFRDPRFPQLDRLELEAIEIEISVLSPPAPITVSTREALLADLVPHEDGLIIEVGRQRATFLPQVWLQLPEPAHFLKQLLQKAGLPGDQWPADIRCQRYRCNKFSEADHFPG